MRKELTCLKDNIAAAPLEANLLRLKDLESQGEYLVSCWLLTEDLTRKKWNVDFTQYKEFAQAQQGFGYEIEEDIDTIRKNSTHSN